MENCLFCRIANKEMNAAIVHEDDSAIAFRDINPKAPVHVLVIPKQHIATIDDVGEEHEAIMGHLFRVASLVARQEGLQQRGYRVVMNCKEDAGQTVFHVHLHVFGGRALGWPPFPAG